MAAAVFVAGLGNLPYPLTRHSVGQLVVDGLAHRLNIRMGPARGGIMGSGNIIIGRTHIALTLFKSKSLMNISGPSIVNAARATVRAPSRILLLADSLSHRPQTVSLKLGGSANGHNGVKSVIAALGGEVGFHRLRLGIGRDEGSDAAEYVLQQLSGHERRFWGDEGLDLVLNEIEKVALKKVV